MFQSKLPFKDNKVLFIVRFVVVLINPMWLIGL